MHRTLISLSVTLHSTDIGAEVLKTILIELFLLVAIVIISDVFVTIFITKLYCACFDGISDLASWKEVFQ